MKIFISYAEDQEDVVEKVALTLKDHGHKVMSSVEDYPEATTATQRLQKAIKEADIFLFLISPKSVETGSFSMSQLKIARQKWRSPKNNIIPVIAEPVEEVKIPAFIKTLDVYEPEGEIVSEISNAVYFSNKKQKIHKAMVLSGAVCLFMICLIGATYFILGHTKKQSVVKIEQDLRNVAFKFSPNYVALEKGAIAKIRLMPLNVTDNDDYYCEIPFEGNHHNIKNIEYDSQCKTITFTAQDREMADENGKVYFYTENAETIPVIAKNDDRKVIWQSQLSVTYMKTL